MDFTDSSFLRDKNFSFCSSLGILYIYHPVSYTHLDVYKRQVDGIAGPATLKALGISETVSAGGNVSDSDYQLLARIISAEARGEPYIGQVAVGAVVLNRVEHPSFPDTIAGVVYQPGAFTAITDCLLYTSMLPY